MHEYVAAAGEAWLSATTTSKSGKVLLEAAWTITDVVRSFSVEAILAESQLPTMSTRFQTISRQIAEEWAILLRADDRRRTIFTEWR